MASPIHQDRALMCEVLRQSGIAPHDCATVEKLLLEIKRGATAAIVTEELLASQEVRQQLSSVLSHQPPWSDFPLLLLVSRNHRPNAAWNFLGQFGDTMHLALLERPLHRATLISAVRSAARSRGRQYQVRDELAARLAAQAATRESEQRFRVMADNLPILVWLHDPAGQLQFVNQTYCDFFGVTRDLLGNNQWLNILHPEDAAAYVGEFMACTREQRPFHARIRCQRLDGKWRWLESWSRPYYSARGAYLGHIGGSVDVTARKTAEEDVQRLNATLEAQVVARTATLAMLRDIASIANATTNVEQAIYNTLKKLCHHWGWSGGRAWLPVRENNQNLEIFCSWQNEQSAENFPYQRWGRSVQLSDEQHPIARVFRTGRPEMARETEFLTSSAGSQHSLEDLSQPVNAFAIASAEQVVGVMDFFSAQGVVQTSELCDAMTSVGTLLGRMVEREKARRALRESEQQLEAILNAVPDAVIAADHDGTITRVNAAAEHLFGHSTQEMIGQGIGLFMPSPYREEHGQYIARYLATGNAKIIGIGRELSGKTRSGRIFPIDLAVSEIADQRGFVGSIRDISDRKELERQVVNASATEQRRIGHDIHDGVGQELTGLRYVAQSHLDALLAEDSPHAKTAQRMKEWLATIQQQMRTIIRQLVPVEVDEQGLVAALDGLAQQTVETHGLDCCFECPQAINVPDAVLATHLFRIAQESIRNAVRHASASQIRVLLTETDGTLKLEIADNGIGMRSAQAPPQEPSRGGVGLRSMAYRAGLIRAELEIDSGVEPGTRIICTVIKESRAAH